MKLTRRSGLADVEFLRKGGHYEHPEAGFFVEFFPGPLAVRENAHVRPAVEIAHRQSVDLEVMRAWSIREGALQKFAQFVAELERR